MLLCGLISLYIYVHMQTTLGQEDIPMKHSTKKILSLVLASIMMLSLLPLTAYAGEATEKEQATAETAVEKSSGQDTRGGY